MQKYGHKVGAIFSNVSEANLAYHSMKASGFPENQIIRIEPKEFESDGKNGPEDDEVFTSRFKELFTEAAAESEFGAGANTAAATGIIGFFAAPVLVTLVTAGYGPDLASAAEKGKTLRFRETDFALMIKDAVRHDHAVIVAHAKDGTEEALALELLSPQNAEELVGC